MPIKPIKNQDWSGRVYESQVELPPGTSYEVQFALNTPATVTVHAMGDGVSALVEYSTSPGVSVEAKTALFQPLKSFGTAGVVANDYDTDVTPGPLTAIRVTATGSGPVVVEVLQ